MSLTELIIPADEHSPGARAAAVAAYIDGRLAESLEPDWQAKWRSGLQAVDGCLASSMRSRSSRPRRTSGSRSSLAWQRPSKTPRRSPNRFFESQRGRTGERPNYTSKIADPTSTGIGTCTSAGNSLATMPREARDRTP